MKLTDKMEPAKKLLATFLLMAATVPAFAADGAGSIDDTTVYGVMAAIAIFQLILIMVVSSTIKTLAGNKEIWFKKNDSDNAGGGNAVKAVLALVGLSLFANTASAADGASSMFVVDDNLFTWMVITNVILFAILLWLLSTLRGLLDTAAGRDTADAPGWMDRLTRSMTDAVPVEHEMDVMTDHEYDGIRELDNNLPPWWVAMFWITILFGVGYIINYHIAETGMSQTEELAAEMAEAEAEVMAYFEKIGGAVTEENVELLDNPALIAQGKEMFLENCAACHMADGGGKDGPNLTDAYWIHGGGIKNVFRTINKGGRPGKGMIAWGDGNLNGGQIQQIASFILTELQGTTPAAPKDPEGDLWTGEEEAPADEAKADEAEEAPAEEATDGQEEETPATETDNQNDTELGMLD